MGDRELVKEGPLEDHEFWQERDERSTGGIKGGDGRKIGSSVNPVARLLSDLAPTSSSISSSSKKGEEGSTTTIKLTPEDKQRIFLLYPAVKVAYDEQVPQKMTEREFWVRFVRSQYFRKVSGNSSSSNQQQQSSSYSTTNGDSSDMLVDDMFSRYEEKENVESLKRRRVESAGELGRDPTIDLTFSTSDYFTKEATAFDVLRKRDGEASMLVVNKINRLSSLMVEEVGGEGDVEIHFEDDPILNHSSNKKKRSSDDIQLKLIGRDVLEHHEILEDSTNKYLPTNQGLLGIPSSTPTSLLNLQSSLSKAKAFHLGRSEDLGEEWRNHISSLYIRCNELLRHFYWELSKRNINLISSSPPSEKSIKICQRLEVVFFFSIFCFLFISFLNTHRNWMRSK